MSADILSDKEVASLLKRAAATLENPDLGAPGGDEDVPALVADLDETAKALDARRGIGIDSDPHFMFQLTVDHRVGFAVNGTLGTAAMLRRLADVLDGPEPGNGPWLLQDSDGNNGEARYTSSFTVVGVFEDTGQVFADHVAANDPLAAMVRVALAYERGLSNCQILGAIPGEHQLTVPCEDTGKSAYAVDLVKLESEAT